MAGADAGQRALDHIEWAVQLLNLPEDAWRREFRSEFVSYWRHSVLNAPAQVTVVSLIEPRGPSREVAGYLDLNRRQLIAADDRASLVAWLRNSGRNPSDSAILPVWLEWLHRPWIPAQFPKLGTDVLKLLPQQAVQRILAPGRCCPVIFGTKTITGTVFVATLLRGASESDVKKGFRRLANVPQRLIANSFGSRRVRRCKVLRADGSWVHGRDHDVGFRSISKRNAAIIGCGSLGAAIARLLAQAGAADFILVDGDDLTPDNTSRHVLGQRHIGKNKAVATASMLMEDFPHIRGAAAIDRRFEAVTSSELDQLSGCDVVITAGVEYDCDAQVDNWRRALSRPPVHICAWTEAFAIAGHAVALIGADSLRPAFDVAERVSFRLTDWPEGSGAFIVEAGCGNVFQPHGAIELQSAISLAAGLAVDVLAGTVINSVRRVWMGDRDAVAKRGGIIRPAFSESRCFKEYPWP